MSVTTAASGGNDVKHVTDGARPAFARVVRLPVSALQIGPTLRVDGIHEDRVEVLMQSPDEWDPIVVAHADWTVIDGCHRALAARRLHMSDVAVVRFDGSAREEFIEFVRLNLQYGDGFSHRERQNAAWRVLSSYPEWSDRRVGDLCGISTKTVANIRSGLKLLAPGRGVEGIDYRVGRDGRRRPVDAGARRAEIAEALREDPDASLREIARRVGVSPETVRSVRARLSEIELSEGEGPYPQGFGPGGRWTVNGDWCPDVAFTSRDGGVVAADFFDRTRVAELDFDHSTSVPLSRVYEVADEARRRAAFWSAFADRVEGRAK